MKRKTKLFIAMEFVTELLGWFRIVVSPLLIGIGIGASVYFYKQDTTGFIIGLSVSCIGLIVGIILATSIWKKQGTMQFLSRIIATPDLDKNEEEKIPAQNKMLRILSFIRNTKCCSEYSESHLRFLSYQHFDSSFTPNKVMGLGIMLSSNNFFNL